MTDAQFISTIGNIVQNGWQVYFSAFKQGESKVFALVQAYTMMFEGTGDNAAEALEDLIRKAKQRGVETKLWR